MTTDTGPAGVAQLMRMQGEATGLVAGRSDATHVIDVVASLPAYRRINRSGADAIGALLPRASSPWLGMISCWDAIDAHLEEMREVCVPGDESSGWRTTPYDAVARRPPLPWRSSRIFAAGANFARHLDGVRDVPQGREMTAAAARSVQAAPAGFHVLPDLVVGDQATVAPPPGTTFFDYEAEFAAVLAVGGRHIPRDEVRFWAVGPWTDFSIRDLLFGRASFEGGPITWTLHKNFETGKAFGPWVQTLGDGAGGDDLTIRCHVDGELRQEGHSGDMTWSLAAIAEHISAFLELRPGDVLVSGTPAGTAAEQGETGPFLNPGQRVASSIEGVGVLTNWVGDWQRPEATTTRKES